MVTSPRPDGWKQQKVNTKTVRKTEKTSRINLYIQTIYNLKSLAYGIDRRKIIANGFYAGVLDTKDSIMHC